MKHKKLVVGAATATLVTLSTPAIAAELHNAEGQTCTGVGTWHFVNVHVPKGTALGTLEATFTSGTHIVGAKRQTGMVQHFFVRASGTLLDAETNLPGMLNLSDYTCDTSKKS